MTSRLAVPGAFALAAALAGSGGAPPAVAASLPPIVFVSRERPAGPDSLVVPGLGPRGRTRAPGGGLLVRDARGAVRPLVPAGTFFDVSDPAVSWDGRWIAFAAVVAPDSAWRIWRVDADGGRLAAVTRTDGAADPPDGRYDDVDPCWLPDGRLCFASTRMARPGEPGNAPAPDLFTVGADGRGPTRLTSERHGAGEPAVDPREGRIVYARRFANRWLASDIAPAGVTDDPRLALPAPHVDLWQAVSVLPDGERLRLAGGDPRDPARPSLDQPAPLADGSLWGVELAPAAGARPRVRRHAPAIGPGTVVGAGVARAACGPAALPDGRVLLSLDPRGDGDYGLWVAGADGRRLTPLLDLPGTLELDAAALVARPVPPVASEPRPSAPERAGTIAELESPRGSFRFDCLNVFATGAVDGPFPEAPALRRGVRIRFYATLPRPAAAGGDTVVLVRESAVTPSGAVHEDDLPGDVPMFEQLVDPDGRVLRAGPFPAHGPGLNASAAGTGTRCVGCHAGHSALPLAPNYREGKYTNAAPSARVSASSVRPGADARAAVDRRTRGVPAEVAWVAETAAGQWLRLDWTDAIEAREVVLYGLRPGASGRVRVGACEVVCRRAGREVARRRVDGPLAADGTRVPLAAVRMDELEIRPLEVGGRLDGRPAAVIAEVETIARLVED